MHDNADFGEDMRSKDDRRGVHLGYWKEPPKESIADKHAINGFIWSDGTFRFKIDSYTRDGKRVEGYSPSGLEMYDSNTCVFESYLEGLTRAEIEEYCRVWTEYDGVDRALEVIKRRLAIFDPNLKGLTPTEANEYLQICTRSNDIGWAIEVAKRRIAINAEAEGLNSVEWDEKRCIRLAHQALNQNPLTHHRIERYSREMRLERNNVKYEATENSNGSSETATSICQNVDDRSSTPPKRKILRRRTHSSRTRLLEPSEESDEDSFQETSDFEPDEESDESFESSTDEDTSASYNANQGSQQEPSQNAGPLSPNKSIVEKSGHRRRPSRRTSASQNRKLSVARKYTARRLIVRPPLPSLKYQKVSRVEEAIGLLLEDFNEFNNLSKKDMVAAINAVRTDDDASVFLILKSHKKLRRSWILNEVRKSKLGIFS